jgi:hypothetical protein
MLTLTATRRPDRYVLGLWQLPTTLVGYLLVFLLQCSYAGTYRDIKIFKTNAPFSISLGGLIIISDTWIKEYVRIHNDKAVDRLFDHEWGHTRQSILLGPWYLLLVGIPSIVQHFLSLLLLKMGHPHMDQFYYNRYPEKWADRLGGVVREYPSRRRKTK